MSVQREERKVGPGQKGRERNLAKFRKIAPLVEKAECQPETTFWVPCKIGKNS